MLFHMMTDDMFAGVGVTEQLEQPAVLFLQLQWTMNIAGMLISLSFKPVVTDQAETLNIMRFQAA